MKTKKNKKIKKFFSITGWIVIGALLFVGLFSFIDRATGYNFSFFGIRTSFIISPSMASVHADNETMLEGYEDRYYKDDLIFVKVVKNPEEVEKYDVILFYSAEYKTLITHRVINIFYDEVNDNYFFLTRGDANNVDDPLVSFSNVKGVVTKRVGGIGSIFGFINSGYGLFAFTTIGAIFFGSWFLQVTISEKEKKKKEKLQQDNEK